MKQQCKNNVTYINLYVCTVQNTYTCRESKKKRIKNHIYQYKLQIR